MDPCNSRGIPVTGLFIITNQVAKKPRLHSTAIGRWHFLRCKYPCRCLNVLDDWLFDFLANA